MDALIAFFSEFGPQHWLIVGLVLLIAEMATGTTYLLWPAVAGFLTALAAWLGVDNWMVEGAIFAVLVIVLTAFGRPLVKRWREGGTAHIGLNDRATSMIGLPGVIEHFANGAGSVKVGDTVWRATSEETLEAGAQVQIAAVDGTTLKVKRA